jgi:tetratricopeptide (TPR) repeat protein
MSALTSPKAQTTTGRATEQAAEQAFAAFRKEDYRQAMLLGARALASEPNNHELRLMVANSMSWNGRYEAAIEQYEKLYGTPQEASARVGIGNILRWRGLAHAAEPFHQRAVEQQPGNAEARKALAQTQRDLRPTTTARFNHFDDNQNYKRNELAVSHRAWVSQRGLRYDIGTVLGREGASSSFSAKEINGALYWPSDRFSGRVEASVVNAGSAYAGKTQAFARVSADFGGDVASLRIGRVNWGKISNNQQALIDGLTANQIGGSFNLRSLAGDWRGRADLYKISDGNSLWDLESSFRPSWQPLPAGLYVQGGIFSRKANRSDPRYWSPTQSFSLLTLGLGKNWWGDRGDFSAYVQRGFAMNAQSKSNFSLSLSGRYWLNNDQAIGAELYVSDAPRVGAYRSSSVSLQFQQLW